MKETKKNIIVVGYPKSGTTWLSRLVSELVCCPLMGDWGFDDLDQPYAQGINLNSEFQCFKSHLTYSDLKDTPEKDIYKIIYILRDPRDIVISGIHFFDFVPQRLQKFIKALPKGVSFYKILKRPLSIIYTKKNRKKQMINAVLNGASFPSKWLQSSWYEHYQGYKNTNTYFVKYEDLIDNTKIEILKIITHLNIQIDENHIGNSINKHSLTSQKQFAIKTNNQALKKITRKGSYGYWKEEFTTKEVLLFNEKIISDMYSFK